MAEPKYYAKPVDPEFFNYEYYYNDEEAVYDKFWAGGNRKFSDINGDLTYDVRKALEYCEYDLEQVLDYDNATEEEQLDDLEKTLRSYFKREDKQNLTNSQLSKLFKIVMGTGNSDDIVCQVLEIIYGEPFKHGTIHGNSQGDWMNYVCPASLSQDRIDYIEAVLFATGTEFVVTAEKIDDPDKFEDVDLENYFTAAWNETEMKNDLAKQIGCQPNEIEILER